MAESNALVAAQLRQYAGVLRIEKADRFKIKAYERAADTLDALTDDVARLVRENEDLTQFPGIGTALAGVIKEIVRKGTFHRFAEAVAKLSPEMAELASRPRLDPSKIARVYKKLGISSLVELRNRLEAGEIRDVFGPRLDFHVRRGLDDRPRTLLWSAEKWTPMVQKFLESLPSVHRVAAVGSVRRKQDTVGDVGFLVSSGSASSLFRQFAKFGGAQLAERRSETEQSFRLSSGNTITVRWTSEQDWALSLVLATGSKAHVDRLRERAKRNRIAFTARSLGRGSATDEASVYRRLGLKYVEPELREDRGEIEAAAANKLPKLIAAGDLLGDLHMHTTASDGANSILEMAEAARERGYRYIAITDHSQSLKLTNGLSVKRLLAQIRRIDKLNARWNDFVILKSAEVDILEDGKLDYSGVMLKELDLTICSIHSRFALDRRKQTERILKAMDNRYFTILGHPTGRLLLSREGYEIDIERILRHAKSTGCFVEINSSPNRLDLSDENAKLAKEIGVKVAVNTDAHSIAELNFISAGLNQARRGWLESRDVLNTLTASQLQRTAKR